MGASDRFAWQAAFSGTRMRGRELFPACWAL